MKPKIAGIVLAAGESSRLGKPKQLLTWRGDTLLRHVIKVAINAELNPIIVVTGYDHLNIEATLTNQVETVQLVNNPQWNVGQSTSIKAGLENLNQDINACLFFMSDQPQIPVNLVRQLINVYTNQKAPIIAPRVDNRRGNPVLFDRTIFNELRKLKGNEGGRVLFDRYPVVYLDWPDSSIFLDVDTMDDYRKLIELE